MVLKGKYTILVIVLQVVVKAIAIFKGVFMILVLVCQVLVEVIGV